MKTKPILFSTPMVQAILEGKKTKTRRIIPDKIIDDYYNYDEYCNMVMPYDIPCTRTYEKEFYLKRCKYSINDILWVREIWRIVGWNVGDPFKIQYKDGSVINNIYLNEEKAINYNIQCTDQCINAGLIPNNEGYFNFKLKDCPTKWRPSIFMPKEAARIFLKVKNIRVERLHDISENDAIAEGIQEWQSINANWDENPFVWVYEFEITERPENFA